MRAFFRSWLLPGPCVHYQELCAWLGEEDGGGLRPLLAAFATREQVTFTCNWACRTRRRHSHERALRRVAVETTGKFVSVYGGLSPRGSSIAVKSSVRRAQRDSLYNVKALPRPGAPRHMLCTLARSINA